MSQAHIAILGGADAHLRVKAERQTMDGPEVAASSLLGGLVAVARQPPHQSGALAHAKREGLELIVRAGAHQRDVSRVLTTTDQDIAAAARAPCHRGEHLAPRQRRAQGHGVERAIAQLALQQLHLPWGHTCTQVPQLDEHVIPATTCHQRSVAWEGHHRDGAFLCLQKSKQLASARVPEHHLATCVHGADDNALCAGEGHLRRSRGQHRLLDGQHGPRAARVAGGQALEAWRREVEQRDGCRPVLEAVAAGNGTPQGSTMRPNARGPLHIPRHAGKLRFGQLAGRRHLPEKNHVIGAAREEVLTVRRDGTRPHGASVTLESSQVFALWQAPGEHELVLAACEESLARRIHDDMSHWSRVLLQNHILFALHFLLFLQRKRLAHGRRSLRPVGAPRRRRGAAESGGGRAAKSGGRAPRGRVWSRDLPAGQGELAEDHVEVLVRRHNTPLALRRVAAEGRRCLAGACPRCRRPGCIVGSLALASALDQNSLQLPLLEDLLRDTIPEFGSTRRLPSVSGMEKKLLLVRVHDRGLYQEPVGTLVRSRSRFRDLALRWFSHDLHVCGLPLSDRPSAGLYDKLLRVRGLHLERDQAGRDIV
mmetsp:Transcript_12967/g.46038  ORF Transcript_12967/g.46038 Transcript_12967/m.46038 type:complete len:595 (-) Transcript_12967:188-1972(-)